MCEFVPKSKVVLQKMLTLLILLLNSSVVVQVNGKFCIKNSGK